ncbi:MULTISPECIES: HupE/UreJ family protein [Rhodomicrobium]|uniref:HupE/UreJ family protein n=1 Tax=Rhodomicrobium TaxID=1068 RepID=UPI00148256FA|nr:MULTISPECIES: HupE/UreJ family protein [Rhodomicrobium]
MTRHIGRLAGVFACALLFPGTAQAHLVSTRFGDFYDGMLHPVTSLEHIVPWLALGLLMAARPQAGRWALLAFPAGLAIGVTLDAAMPALPGFGTANLVSILVLGGLVALDLPLSAAAFAVIACALGISHGYVNGTAMAATTNPVLFAPGVVMAGYLMILLTAAAGAFVTRRWSAARIALRALGSWIFAIGVMMLGTALA